MTGPNPSGICLCGCGQLAPIAKASDLRTGVVAGHPCRFVRGHGGRRDEPWTQETRVRRFWDRVDRNEGEGCWEWQGARYPSHYGRVSVHLGSSRATVMAHRFSWEIHNGPIPEGLVVCHRCDNPPCVNPAHLFVGDVQANHDDMIAKGRMPRGSERAHSKLTEDDVREIRARLADGATHLHIARAFGVHRSTIYDIAVGKKWRHVHLETEVVR